MKLDKKGVPAGELRETMQQIASEDKQWKERLAAGVSYPAGDDVLEVAQQAYIDFFSVNALYPSIFPSTARFEREVIEMTAGLLHGENAVGAISSGGTESNLLGVLSARDRARALRPEVTEPEIVAPESAHPSFQKAADYLGLKVISTPLTSDGLVDVPAYHAAVTDNTVLMVGSAPSTVLGMVDPIPEMAALADERGISFHVDACVGGLLPALYGKAGVRGHALGLPRPRRDDHRSRPPQVRVHREGGLVDPVPRPRHLPVPGVRLRAAAASAGILRHAPPSPAAVREGPSPPPGR